MIDLSIGGAFVETERPLAPGSTASFEFAFPGARRPIRAKVKVEWSGDYFGGSGATSSGMGLSFIALAAEDRLALAAFLKKTYELSQAAVRLKTRLAAQLLTEGHEAKGVVLEIGERSALVRTGLVAPIGAEVDLALALPNATAPVRMSGVVVRVEPAPPDDEDENGRCSLSALRIEFDQVAFTARELIRAFLEDQSGG
jgi:hypothetical protein